MEELDVRTVTKRSVHGIFALISRQLTLQLIGLAPFFVVSTLLKPQDLGIYTAAIAMQRIISFFTDFGIGAALVQKKEALKQEDLETSFTLQAVITLTIFLIIFIFSSNIAQFLRLNEEGRWLVIALVFTIFLSSFKTISAILLERTINFSKLIIPQIIEQLTFTVVLIFLILNNFGISSYSYAFLISGLIGIPFYFFISPWKVRLSIHKSALHHLKFGLQFQAKNILATIKDDFLTVMLVKLLTFTEIGYIGFAQKLSFFTFRYIVDSVTKVTFSTYARFQENKDYLRKSIEKSMFLIGVTMFPLLVGIILTTPYIIEYISFLKWNNKWEPAYFSIIFFCLNAFVSSMSNILVNVLDATGKVQTTLRLMVFWTALTWILTPLSIILFGYNGVAFASFLVTLSIFVTIHLVRKIVYFDFFGSIRKPLAATVGMAIIVFTMEQLFVRNIMTLGIVIILGGVTYLGILYTIAKEEIQKDISSFLKR